MTSLILRNNGLENWSWIEILENFFRLVFAIVGIGTPILYYYIRRKISGKDNMHNEIKENCRQYMNLFKSSSDKRKKCVEEMLKIADDIDKVHRGATIASITGSSFGIAGGITTIVGLALAPVTFGASLIVTAVGIGVATAGGITGAVATITDTVNINKSCSTVKDMISDIQEIIDDMRKCLECIKNLISQLSELHDEEGNMPDVLYAGGKLLSRSVYAATEIGRLAQLFKVSASAARGIKAAGAISGVLTGLFIVIDAVFIVKDAKTLKEGAKTKQAEEIRNKAKELNQIYKDFEKSGREIKLFLTSIDKKKRRDSRELISKNRLFIVKLSLLFSCIILSFCMLIVILSVLIFEPTHNLVVFSVPDLDISCCIFRVP